MFIFSPCRRAVASTEGLFRRLAYSSMIPESWQQGVDFGPSKCDPTSNFKSLDANNTKIDRSRNVQDAMVKDITANNATFENVVLPVARDDNKMAIESHIIGFFQAVSTNQKLRPSSSSTTSASSRACVRMFSILWMLC
jgi:hypothetical protein